MTLRAHLRLLRDRGMTDVLRRGGGIIPDDGRTGPQGERRGAVFGPGTTIAAVAEFLPPTHRPRD